MTRYCQVCGTIKPVRSHHCSQTERCILKMDHFCAWIHNGVGAGNYAQFLQLLVFATACFTYSAGLLVAAMAMPVKGRLKLQYGVCVPSFVVTAVFGFIVAKLLWFHTMLVRSNQTTIEYYENATSRRLNPKFKPPFSKTPKENVREVLPCGIGSLFIPFCRLSSKLPDDGFYHYDPLTGKDFAVIQPTEKPQESKYAQADYRPPLQAAAVAHEFSSQSDSEDIDLQLMNSRRGSLSSVRSERVTLRTPTPMIRGTGAESVLSTRAVHPGDEMVMIGTKQAAPQLTAKEEHPEVEVEPQGLIPLVQEPSNSSTPTQAAQQAISTTEAQPKQRSKKRRENVRKQPTEIENGPGILQAAK